MQISLGEDQRLRHFGPVGKYLREEPFLEGANDQADLVHRHDIAVEIVGVVSQIRVKFLVLLLAGVSVAMRHEKPRFLDERGTALGDLRFDAINVVADVDPIDMRIEQVGELRDRAG